MELFWEKDNWEDEDRHLSQLKALPFSRSFPFIPEKPGLYIIRGPRQIGKSSWLKTILSYHAKKQSDAIAYFSCENLNDHKDLAVLLKSQLGKKILLLDEISFVKEWWRAIKHEVDQNSFPIIVLTGSNTHDLRTGADRMPGRFGHGGDFELLPMIFEEFCEMRKIAKQESLAYIDELLLFFQLGGFPSVLAEHCKGAKTPEESINTYSRWLVGDIIKLGKQEIYLKEIFGQIAQTMTTPMSLQKLAQRTQMGSHHTAQEYISILEDCFALTTLYAIAPDTGAYRFKKEKKFYFRDPLLYRLALEWNGIPLPVDWAARMAEMTAAEDLRRRTVKFGYLSTPKGEIDFYKKDTWAIEVKWANQSHNLSRAFKDLSLAEKIIWTQQNFFKEYPKEFKITTSA